LRLNNSAQLDFRWWAAAGETLSAELVQMFLMMDVDIVINHDYPAGSATATPLATARDTVDALRLTWPESVDLSRQYLMLVTQDEQGVVGVERLGSAVK
jgi:hypothetical protein